MDFLNAIHSEKFIDYFLVIFLFLFMVWMMRKLVLWSKKMSKGAFIFLAIFPIISIFPIPPQEIKKLERIKQEQVKKAEESGDPLED